jgi:hypothetical protein
MTAKGFASLALTGLLNLNPGAAPAATFGDLWISEVMANPAALADAGGEWFELYNPTTETLNLRDLSIGDDGGDLHRIDSDLLILPGHFLTLARSATPGFVPDYVYNGFTLANSADEIVLRDTVAELLRLDYGGGFSVAGVSRELRSLPMTATNYALTPGALSYGAGDFGSPGAAGWFALPLSPVPLPASTWLFVSALLGMLSPRILPRLQRGGRVI